MFSFFKKAAAPKPQQQMQAEVPKKQDAGTEPNGQPDIKVSKQTSSFRHSTNYRDYPMCG